MTYTYLMKAKYGYKIGKSKNPSSRLITFKTVVPDIRILGFGKGVSESELHRRYKYKRINGEWFNLNRKDVEKILNLLKNNYTPDRDSKRYEKKLAFEIMFGKHKGKKISMMTSPEEISYLKWFLRVSKEKSSYTYKIFKWWLLQIE